MNGQSILLLLLIFGLVIVESFGQYCVRKSKTPGCSHYFLFGILAYIMVCIILYHTYNHKPIGIVNALWSAFSVLAVLGIGMYFYHEKLYIFDYIGLLLILIGIFLIFVYGHETSIN